MMDESVVAVLGGYVFGAIAGNLLLVACTADYRHLRAKWDAWRHPVSEAEEERMRNLRYAYT